MNIMVVLVAINIKYNTVHICSLASYHFVHVRALKKSVKIMWPFACYFHNSSIFQYWLAISLKRNRSMVHANGIKKLK